MTNEELKLHVQNLSKTIENWTEDYPEMKYNDLMTIIVVLLFGCCEAQKIDMDEFKVLLANAYESSKSAGIDKEDIIQATPNDPRKQE